LKSWSPPQTLVMQLLSSQPPMNVPSAIPTPPSSPDPDSVYSFAQVWTDSLLQIGQGQHDGRSYQDFVALYADLSIVDESGGRDGPFYGGSAFIRMYDETVFFLTPLHKEDPRYVPNHIGFGAMMLPAEANPENYLSFAKANPQFAQKAN